MEKLLQQLTELHSKKTKLENETRHQVTIADTLTTMLTKTSEEYNERLQLLEEIEQGIASLEAQAETESISRTNTHNTLKNLSTQKKHAQIYKRFVRIQQQHHQLVELFKYASQSEYLENQLKHWNPSLLSDITVTRTQSWKETIGLLAEMSFSDHFCNTLSYSSQMERLNILEQVLQNLITRLESLCLKDSHPPPILLEENTIVSCNTASLKNIHYLKVNNELHETIHLSICLICHKVIHEDLCFVCAEEQQ